MPLLGEAPGRPTYTGHGLVVAHPGRLVHLAYHQVFGGRCVQKTVPLMGMPDAMMLTEPQLIERLEHPHIVKIREAQFDPHDPQAVTYVMPYYAGGSVEQQLLAGGGFSVGQALDLASHLLDAVAYLHVEVGFVHRDVKPGNLLLDAARRVGYLSDFGSAARILAGGTVRLAGFTLPYLDPAAMRCGGLTVASDVYSAGMTLFEMLSGSLVPRLDPAKASARLAQGKRAYPDSHFTHSPHVPAPVRRLVNKAIVADPTRRFASAADMATAVARARRIVIDWTRIGGSGLDGEWQGTWPPSRPPAQRRTYRVVSAVVQRGQRAGQRHLEASYRVGTGTGWRRFGGLVADVGVADHAAVSKFFDTVDDAVAQIKAAR